MQNNYKENARNKKETRKWLVTVFQSTLPLKVFGGSPPHQQMSQMTKWGIGKPCCNCKQTVKMIFGVNFHQGDVLSRVHETDGTWWAQDESTHIVLIYLTVYVRNEVIVKAYCSTEFMDESNKGQEIFASHTEY